MTPAQLRATNPAPDVSWCESPFGGNRQVFEWRGRGGTVIVAIDQLGRAPVWSGPEAGGALTTGTGLDERFMASLLLAGVVRT